jgi:hypothetical protein
MVRGLQLSGFGVATWAPVRPMLYLKDLLTGTIG